MSMKKLQKYTTLFVIFFCYFLDLFFYIQKVPHLGGTTFKFLLFKNFLFILFIFISKKIR